MRICLVSKQYPPSGSGGIATYVHRLAHGLAAAGHDVSVISGASHQREVVGSHRSGPVQPAGEVKRYAVQNARFLLPSPLRRKGLGIWRTIERSIAVDREIARLERVQGPFDVVEMPNWGSESLIYSFHTRAPLVVRLSTPLAQVNHLRGNLPLRPGMRLLCYLEALCARRAACLIANSAFIANACSKLYRIPTSRCSLVPLGLPIPLSRPALRVAENEGVTVLYVGRLERRKGIDLLLHAIPEVIRCAPRTRFVIAGADTGDAPHSGSYRDYFATFASPQARAGATFLGHVDANALCNLYAGCDLFVAPSLTESFGLIFLEAMAHAKPIVAFHTGAVPEIVAQGETGILAEPGNASDLASALVRMANDAQLRHEMGTRGYMRALSNFTLDRMVEKTVACYDGVAVGRSRPAASSATGSGEM